MSFTLSLLRHGEPELAGRFLGSTDCAATAAGIAACAGQGTGLAVERIVSSDLRRAKVCAAAIAGTRPVTSDPRWRELHFGEWEGRASGEIDEAALGAFWRDPDAHPPPGGERWSALCARVGAAIAALEPVPTLVVTHGGAIRAALSHLCGFSPTQAWRFELGYAVLVTLDVWTDGARQGQIRSITPCGD